ncbi:MAG: hypothetical protein HOU81_08660 [Hamadaea sp.]|uniref:lantibiotic dehydratase n=1 Tax=Hamadaea sp. TaxID=2024425 RepID=UPI0017F7DEB3|nr:lantibiotic dehydratase [Hamadaea sp.]NUR70879.1 hypothetical protein [Hamadaea sp.]NUT20866.1 hypothetical protein [Hamadaea sp.]
MSRLVRLDDDWGLWPVAPVRGAGLPFSWLAGLTGDPASALRQLLAEPSFLAALTWQNPGLVTSWAGKPEPGLTSYRLGVLAKYAQRYCAKNDSIGFFGSVGWAQLDCEPGVDLRTDGSGAVRRSEVSLELWAVRALAAALAADSRVAPHLPLRVNPSVGIVGDQAMRPYRPPMALSPEQLAVLDRVRGGATAADFEPADLGHLSALLDAGLVKSGFAVRPSAHPEESLRSQVAALATPDRDDLLSGIDKLLSALAEAEKAALRPAELSEAFIELERHFATMTGEPATRTKADAGTGRTLAYLDCRRDLDVRIPAGTVEQLAAPLALLLQSARWLTAQLGEAVEEELQQVYAGLRKRRSEVTLADLFLAAAEILSGAPRTVVHEIARDFTLRWAEILADVGTDPGAGPVRLSCTDAAPLVSALFPAGEPGWAAARQHSPDLLYAQHGDDSFWVLGELHVAMNTLESRFFHTLADDAGRLDDLMALDMAGGRIVPCYPYGPEIDSRRYPPPAMHVPDRYLYWSHSDDMGTPDGSPAWPAAALPVWLEQGELVAGPDRNSWAHPVREFFGEFLSALAVNLFRLPVPGPRVLLDDLVIRRATWAFEPGDLPAGVLTKSGYRPEVLSAWLAGQGLPRHLFAQMPSEPKPFYVDLSAPVLLANLARSWRRETSGPIRLQEMLPGPDQLWLQDGDGRRYTTEFRFVAVDSTARVLPALATTVRRSPC